MRQWIVDEVLTRLAPALLIAFLAVPTVAIAELPKYEVVELRELNETGANLLNIDGKALSESGHATGTAVWYEYDDEYQLLFRNEAFIYFDRKLKFLGSLAGPDGWSTGADVNIAGDVVGSTQTADGSRAFLYRQGAMLQLGTLGGATSSATAVNDAGQVVGSADTADGTTHAFLYSNGNMVDLGTLGGVGSAATAINSIGQVIGTSITADGESHAFLYSDGIMTDLGTLGGDSSTPTAINDLGQVVGYSNTAEGQSHAFLYSAGAMVDIGNAFSFSRANDINVAGQVTGWLVRGTDSCPYRSAFKYEDGEIQLIGEAVDEAGNIVFCDANGIKINESGDVLWISGPGSHGNVFLNQDGTDVYITSVGDLYVNDLNNFGEVTGSDEGGLGPRAFVATPIAHSFSRLLNDVTGVGPGKSLVDTMAATASYYEADDGPATCDSLSGFINKVEAQAGKKIPLEQAENLIEDATAIREAVGCQ